MRSLAEGTMAFYEGATCSEEIGKYKTLVMLSTPDLQDVSMIRLTLGEASIDNGWLESFHFTEDFFPMKNHGFPASFVCLQKAMSIGYRYLPL